MKKRLGKVQDLVTARHRFEKWMADKSHSLLRPLLAELVQSETDQLEDRVREFRMWWNEERVSALRKMLPYPENDRSREVGELEVATRETRQQAGPQTQRAS
jgi:hypothetical protein